MKLYHTDWKCPIGFPHCEACNDDSHPELYKCSVCEQPEEEWDDDEECYG